MKKKRSLYGLSKRKYDYQESDSSTVFSITEVPKIFGLGKNSFKIFASKDRLLKGTEVYIDIIDSNSNSIYFEVSNMVNNDNTRNVIVFIYEDTAPGYCAICISGTLLSGESYLFQKKVYVDPNQLSESSVIYSNPPVVVFKERLQPIQNTTTSPRSVVATNQTGSISIVSTVKPRKFEDSPLEVEKFPISNSETKLSLSNTSITQVSVDTPDYSDISVLTSKGFTFGSQMQGGTITINNISLQSPGNVSDITLFQSKSYNGLILSVRNSSSIEIYPPLKFNVEYSTTDGENKLYATNKIFSHTNFTVSYYQYLPSTNSFTTQSFASVDFYDLEPEIGMVDRINVLYKTTNQFGDFASIGEFKVRKTNLFLSTSSVQFDTSNGIVEKPIGDFRNGMTDFTTHWVSQSFGTGSCVVDTNNLRLVDGIRVYQTSSRGISDRWLIRPKHPILVNSNTDYVLSLKTYDDQDEVFDSRPQIDIYITGSSNVEPELFGRLNIDHVPYKTSSFGTYIGSAVGRIGKVIDRKFTFSTTNSGSISPILVFRSGVWNISNIEISPDTEIGYTPKQCRLNIPLYDVPRNSELMLRFDYLNGQGKPSEYSSFIYGLYFTGSNNDNDRIIQKVGNSRKITYLYTQDNISCTPVSSNNISVPFPIFKNDMGEDYTGSLDFVGLTYDVRTVVLGRSGSRESMNDSYVWAATSQGRVLITPTYNSGIPFLYDRLDFSGSSDTRALGTYGTSNTKPNFDSWFRMSGVQIANGIMNLRYTLRVTASSGPAYEWSASVVSTCDIIKYEYNR